ncbi:MAG TPA: Fic family protein [Candidatus Polarisedimenticolaceae bacterium]|nr:Fic family protein [Candidatus Polarisedimenticolaceae bacterium]
MSLQFSLPVTETILSVISQADQMRGKWSAAIPIGEGRLQRIREATAIRSIGSSCRLSGIGISDHDVAGILRGQSVVLPDSASVRGYARAMGFPLGNGLLEPATLQRLNAVVLGQDESRPSAWRTHPSHCETFDSEGHATGRVIQILPSRLIEEKIADLVTWFELEMRERARHPLIAIAAFYLGFLAISPFELGNGRTIRVLVGLLMRRAGYDYVPYASLERHMEDLREDYYEALDRTQSGIWTGDADFSPWLDYFMELLDRHRRKLEKKIELERGSSLMTPLQRTIVDTVREHGTVDARLLLQATGANRNTLKDNVRRLVTDGWLEKTGERRATKYRLAAHDRARDALGSESA